MLRAFSDGSWAFSLFFFCARPAGTAKMRVKRATAKRPDLRFDIANYSSESIGKNSKDCAPVRGQIATNRIPNSRCGWNQSQDAVKSVGSCLGTTVLSDQIN